MKFVILALALLPFAFALESESIEPESQLGQTENTNNALPIMEDFNIPEEVEKPEPKVIKGRWDVGAPEQAIKKARRRKKTSPIIKAKPLKIITLTKEFKQAIVMAHNRARSTTIPPASNMRKLTWDNSLEKLATGYSRKCIYEHNPAARHRRFSYVGENLFISMGLPLNKDLLDHAVRAWDGEKSVYNYNTTKCQRGKVCGHYTQVVWADSFKVGCGVTRCGNVNVRGRIWKDAVLFGCNYGPGGNYRGEKPFKAGSRCSECDKRDKCKARLCANTIRDKPEFNPNAAKWSSWSEWSSCTKTCGMGSKKRQRTCNTFVPTDCKGFASEVQFCMNLPCKSNQSSFSYNIVLNDGDNFLKSSILDLFKNQNFFTRKSGK